MYIYLYLYTYTYIYIYVCVCVCKHTMSSWSLLCTPALCCLRTCSQTLRPRLKKILPKSPLRPCSLGLFLSLFLSLSVFFSISLSLSLSGSLSLSHTHTCTHEHTHAHTQLPEYVQANMGNIIVGTVVLVLIYGSIVSGIYFHM